MVSRAVRGREGVVRIAVTTVASASDAARIAELLVRGRTAACVTVFPKVSSTFRWKGKIETEEEHLLWIKTTEERLPQMEQELREFHPYDVPELLVLSADCASPEYLDWLLASTRPADGEP